MRNDMAKVVVDCYRLGARLKAPKGYKKANKITEDSPTKESMRLKWIANWNDGKQFGEHLNPLWRWLRKQVGRPWDKVYSELRTNLKADSVVQSHVLDHADWFVEKNVVMVGKVPCYIKDNSPIYTSRNGTLYVNPNTGLLCYLPNKVNKHQKSPKPIIEKDGRKFLLIKEIWYEVTTENWVDRSYNLSYELKDDIIHGCISRNDAWNHYKDYVVVKTKRQLNSKEIKRLKLR